MCLPPPGGGDGGEAVDLTHSELCRGAEEAAEIVAAPASALKAASIVKAAGKGKAKAKAKVKAKSKGKGKSKGVG